MRDWIGELGLKMDLVPLLEQELQRLAVHRLKPKTVLFQPGDTARGFVVLISGRIHVYLTGRSGRELLLYSVTPGETCLQTTLGLLGEASYSGEGVAETDVEAVIIPPPLFLKLMDQSARFRAFVFRAFAARLSDAFFVMEQVAFVKVEARLARELLNRAGEGRQVDATHQELAVAIGSAREVVSRRLEALASGGLIAADRGRIDILDPVQLERIAGVQTLPLA